MKMLLRHRFSGDAHPSAAEFLSSIRDDEKIVRFDLEGSRAHARMLRKVGLLTAQELRKILAALDRIGREVSQGKRKLRVELEDVHMNVERWLTQMAGAAGAKIHTGRQEIIALRHSYSGRSLTRLPVAQSGRRAPASRMSSLSGWTTFWVLPAMTLRGPCPGGG